MEGYEEYIVYVQTDAEGHITGIDSSAFVEDTTGWIEIDRGTEWPKYRLAQGNYFPKPIHTEEGLYRYKLVAGQPEERTQAELDAELEAYLASLPPAGPTLQEQIDALTIAVLEG